MYLYRLGRVTYQGGHPGTDRVVFDGQGRYLGVVTYRGEDENSFQYVRLPDDPSEVQIPYVLDIINARPFQLGYTYRYQCQIYQHPWRSWYRLLRPVSSAKELAYHVLIQ
jgi:hypothetical protein